MTDSSDPLSAGLDPIAETDSEMALLAAYAAHPETLTLYPVASHAWSTPKHVAMHDVLLELEADGVRPQASAVCARLAKRDALRRWGGERGVFDLLSQDPTGFATPADLRDRVAHLARCRAARELHRLGALAAANEDIAASVTAASEVLAQNERTSRITVLDLDQLVRERMVRAKAGEDPDEQPRIPTGIPAVDSLLRGIGVRECWAVGADSNVGKTHFALFLARNLRAVGKRVGIISCEDPVDVFAERQHAILTAIMRARIEGPAPQLVTLFGATDTEVCEAMAVLVKVHGCEVIMVDYVQAIDASRRTQDRRNDVASVARRIKSTAQRLSVPLVLLSQITTDRDSRRTVDARGKAIGSTAQRREPDRNDLRDARELTQTAEVVVLLWRAHDFDACPVRAKIAKGKRGANEARWWMRRVAAGAFVLGEGRFPADWMEDPMRNGEGTEERTWHEREVE